MGLSGQDIGFSEDNEYTEGDYAEIDVDIDEADGSAKDLEGATAKWSIAKQFGDDPELSESDAGVDVSVTDDAGGIVTITLDGGTTQGLSGTWRYEVEVTDSNSRPITTTKGRFKIKSGIID